MLKISKRCETLKHQAIFEKPHNGFKCAQRDFWYARGLDEVQDDSASNITISAAGLASVIKNAPPLIGYGELIVGYNFADGPWEYLSGDPDALRLQLKSGEFSDEDIEWYINNSGRCHAKFNRILVPTQTETYELTEKDDDLRKEIATIGICNSLNHSVIAYDKVLRLGFKGLLKEVEEHSEANGGGEFYEALKTVCRAGCLLGERYAEHAERLASECSDPVRAAELRRIAAVCRRVPRYPAESFYEAVQSLWFSHIINTWEDYINANSLGRLDQILYPYYQADIESGRLTREEAFELLCCLWIKLYRDYDVQQSCVGGADASGSSQVNELSYLMLDVTEALGFVRCLSVRFSKSTEPEFLRRALEVVGRLHNGIPFFFNDDVMIPALKYKGIPREDAADYANIGCVETVIPGKSNPHAVSGRCNFAKAVEYTLGNGHSIMNPELCPGLTTGDAEQFGSYEQFKDAVYAQIRHLLDSTCKQIALAVPPAAVNYPMPYKSLLTEDCLSLGKDFNAGGPKYNYFQICLIGIPNVADSLIAVNELVFRQKKYTMGELLYHISHNFPDEAVRLDFLGAPKYGNDIDEVDSLAADITDYACDLLDEFSDKYGYSFHAQPFSFYWMIDHGRTTAATPDGRRKGENLAYSMSPTQGRDRRGLTAVLQTLTKLPTKRTPGTTSAIIEVSPTLFEDANLDVMTILLRTAAEMGLSNVQFNIVDAETLKQAKAHPDRFANLEVRVSGFSQRFIILSPDLQDHIIARTKHAAL